MPGPYDYNRSEPSPGGADYFAGGEPNPGASSVSDAPTPPKNNLVWAILVTIFCCQPLGIYAIVKAANVDSMWATGNYLAAQDEAAAAKKWSKWGALIGGFFIAVYLVLALMARQGSS